MKWREFEFYFKGGGKVGIAIAYVFVSAVIIKGSDVIILLSYVLLTLVVLSALWMLNSEYYQRKTGQRRRPSRKVSRK